MSCQGAISAIPFAVMDSKKRGLKTPKLVSLRRVSVLEGKRYTTEGQIRILGAVLVDYCKRRIR